MTAIKHIRRYNGANTLAIEVPEHKDTLFEMLETGVFNATVGLGITFVNPKDQYNKKTGRELAISKMRPQVVNLTGIEPRDPSNGKTIFHFGTEVYDRRGKRLTLSFGYSIIAGSPQPRLEYATLTSV